MAEVLEPFDLNDQFDKMATRKQHVFVMTTQIGSLRLQASVVETSDEVRSYVWHLEQNIHKVTTAVERDRTVHDELAEIKRLLHMSPNYSFGGTNQRRSPRSLLRDKLTH